MTFNQYQLEFDDLIDAFNNNDLTESQLEHEMEMLEERWQEEGEY